MSNITQVVNVDKNLKTLKTAVHGSDLDQLLSSTGPFTFFTPSDAAFEKLESGMIANLVESKNKEKLAEILNNHIVDGKILFKELKDGDQLQTLGAKKLSVEVKNGDVRIDGAAVTARDQKISNGVIHSTDTVFA